MTSAPPWETLGWVGAGTLSCIEILVAELVVIGRRPPREHAGRTALLWVALTALLAWVAALATGFLSLQHGRPDAVGVGIAPRVALLELVFFSSYLVLTIPLLLGCLEINLWAAIYAATAGYAMQNLASGLAETVGLMLAQRGVALSLPASGLVTVLSCAALYAVLWRLVIRRTGAADMSAVRQRSILAMVVIVILAVIGFDLLLKASVLALLSPVVALCLRAFHAVVCLFVLLVEVEMVINRQLEDEVETTERLMAERERQYALSRESIEAINLKCHDLRHQIRRLSDADTAVVDKGALADIAREVAVYDSSVRTGNDALDTILTEKSLLCESRGVTLTCMADGSALSFMAAADIYSFFGNALDNALEAVSVLPDDAMRSISLLVRRRAGMASIHVENFYAPGTRLDFEDGLPQTTKDDRMSHGFGTRSMRATAARYGGTIAFSGDNGTFCLDALLPLPQPDHAAEGQGATRGGSDGG